MNKILFVNKEKVILSEEELLEYFKRYLAEIDFFEKIIRQFHSNEDARVDLILNKAIPDFNFWLVGELLKKK